MKVFIDANILVAVLNQEYPNYTHAARVLSWVSDNGHQLYTTTICLAIVSYFAEKKHGAKRAKEKMAVLAEHFFIADCGKLEVVNALADKKVKDFEDGLQYYAAANSLCSCIVTENKEDFYFSILSVYNAEEFLKRYYRRS